MTEQFHEIMFNLLNDSVVLFLDVRTQPSYLPKHLNFHQYITRCLATHQDFTLPELRQQFNNDALATEKKSYGIGRYGEDRKALLKGSQMEKEGRTIHLGIDIFTQRCEAVFAPASGTICLSGYEQGERTYGHYLVIEHKNRNKKWYSFFGHLSGNKKTSGKVHAGEQIAVLGTTEENGGWSIHLHYQILTYKPHAPPHGYCAPDAFPVESVQNPDPRTVLGPLY